MRVIWAFVACLISTNNLANYLRYLLNWHVHLNQQTCMHTYINSAHKNTLFHTSWTTNDDWNVLCVSCEPSWLAWFQPTTLQTIWGPYWIGTCTWISRPACIHTSFWRIRIRFFTHPGPLMMTEMLYTCHMSLCGLPDFNQQPCKRSEVPQTKIQRTHTHTHTYTHANTHSQEHILQCSQLQLQQVPSIQ
jgi:hypothetical protein